ncbi:hypothetical protein [Amycolatopsis benzoatilytica]|uniref:hypothetical protein n=1 Tax=Amycolatopsis benzoatilytica TaxID=346045 RepID=UPI0003703688|nr:hypothetical protein [Amycolatopsis benzoatilytica]
MTPRIAAAPFLALGTACTVAGGLASAVIAPAPTPHGAWAVAYLVLVGGVAQTGLGIGQAVLAPRLPTVRAIVAQAVAWNAGNAAVLGGTLAGITTMVDVGGAILVLALALFAFAVRGGGRTGQRWLRYGFEALVLVLLVSIPVGLVLARIGPS